MSIQAIQRYHAKVEKTIRYGGSRNESSIRERFNTYRFADYKEAVIDLLRRVVTVSVETVKIVDAMRALEAGDKNYDHNGTEVNK